MARTPTTHRRTGTYRNSRGQTESSRSVVLASATLVSRNRIRRGSRKASWTDEAWAFFDTIGELHAATTWLGNAMSRVRLFIADSDEDGDGGAEPSPADEAPPAALDALGELLTGHSQGNLLRRLSINIDVVGEAYLVRLPKNLDPTADSDSSPYRWVVASVDEFSQTGGTARLSLPDDGQRININLDETTVIRLWNPHPRQAWESDSPVRANLPMLREVQALSQHITATVESRLAGAGVLAIPKSATLPNPNIQEGANPLHHDAFVDALMQGMITPITDRDNASAYVPIVVSVDDEAIGKIQHLSFWSELSSQVTEMRQAALQRFAAGTDLPQELILGLGDSSHWNAAEIEQQAVKVAIEPTAGVICDALTQHFLWPAMRAMGVDDPERWVISFSTQELTQRPDRSEDAQALYDKGVLGPDAVLREAGFSPSDRPNDDEKRKEFARQLALAKPELMPALAPYVGFEGMEDVFSDVLQSTAGGQGGEPGGEQPPGQQGPMDPENDPDITGDQPGNMPAIPQQRTPSSSEQRMVTVTADASRMDRSEEVDEWRITAIELVALRALELAGKRMLTKSSRGLRGSHKAAAVHTWDLHTVADQSAADLDRLLSGAFDMIDPAFHLDERGGVRTAVENYCKALIRAGRPHRREYLVQALRQSGVTRPTSDT